MKKPIVTIALFLMMPALVAAQNTDQKSQGLGYIFAGDGTHGMGLTSGFGGEYINKSGLGWSAEIAAAGFRTSANGNPNFIGVGSTDLTYHFFHKKAQSYAPFVAGGYTIFFGQDTDTPGGNVTNGVNVGGRHRPLCVKSCWPSLRRSVQRPRRTYPLGIIPKFFRVQFCGLPHRSDVQVGLWASTPSGQPRTLAVAEY
jgi:hypothetical protein